MPLFAGFVPRADAILVERLRAAGAVPIGKTGTPEWGLASRTYDPVFGTTTDAYDPARAAGGGSGGGAGAVAPRMGSVPDGGDFGGSPRDPPGWNDAFGWRPSRGRVPFAPTGGVFVQQPGHGGRPAAPRTGRGGR